jgi:thioredoxin-like negative regulator of GroEL
LAKRGVATEAFEALDSGEHPAALDFLLDEIAIADEQTREQLRRAAIGVLSELAPDDPAAATYRRRLAQALY